MTTPENGEHENHRPKIEGFQYVDKFPQSVNFEGNVYAFGNELPEQGVAVYSRLIKPDFPTQREFLFIDTTGSVQGRTLQDEATDTAKRIKGK